MQEAPEKRGLVQQLQFWRRESSSQEMDPDEAVLPPQAPEDLDDVDALMARLAEQQVRHSCRATQLPCDVACIGLSCRLLQFQTAGAVSAWCPLRRFQ
jgi:hypothetical protein